MFKVCARCGQEYQAWATECTDCGVALDLAPGETLAPAATPPAPALEDLVPFRLGGPWELQALAEALQEHGISSRIDSHPPGEAITGPRAHRREGYSGSAIRLGLYVSRTDLDAAQAIANELVARDLPDAEQVSADPMACPACGEPTPENAAACRSCGLEFPEADTA